MERGSVKEKRRKVGGKMEGEKVRNRGNKIRRGESE